MKLRHRELGGQGLEVAAIGLGPMGMTVAYAPSDEADGIATIRSELTEGDLAPSVGALPEGAFGGRYPSARMRKWV